MRTRLGRWPYLLPPLALAAVLLLWVRSYLPDYCFVRVHEGRIAVFFVSGSVAARFDPAHPNYLETDHAISNCRQLAQARGGPVAGVAGFEWIGIDFKNQYQSVLLIPLWALALAALGASVWAWLAYRRHRDRDRPGHCDRCGYDLKGNVSGVCPECGGAAAAAPAKEAA